MELPCFVYHYSFAAAVFSFGIGGVAWHSKLSHAHSQIFFGTTQLEVSEFISSFLHTHTQHLLFCFFVYFVTAAAQQQ